MVAAGHRPEDVDSGAQKIMAFAEEMLASVRDVYYPEGKGFLKIRVGKCLLFLLLSLSLLAKLLPYLISL